ncbi:MAG: SH3 domain-containing protein, partial [Ruminococcus sp.]|nr:SH3 domain-containing protein [Ruminococcus sp.]
GNLAYTDKNLIPGTSYKYAIRAYKTVDGKEVLSKTYPEITVKTSKSTAFKSYKVKVTANALNIRKGAGTNYAVTGVVKKNEVYTIVGESKGTGATKWLKLKSGAGYISSDYVKKV